MPQSIEKLTPIGSKIVIERWKDSAKSNYYSISLVYESLDQLRNAPTLSLDNPPIKYELEFEGLSKESNNLYKEADFLSHFQQKVDLDATIRETYKN